MTHMAKLLGFNRAVEDARSGANWCELSGRVIRSVRFGAHDFIAGKTMQIIPVRKSKSSGRLRFSINNAKKRKRTFDGSGFTSIPVEYAGNFCSWFNV